MRFDVLVALLGFTTALTVVAETNSSSLNTVEADAEVALLQDGTGTGTDEDETEEEETEEEETEEEETEEDELAEVDDEEDSTFTSRLDAFVLELPGLAGAAQRKAIMDFRRKYVKCAKNYKAFVAVVTPALEKASVNAKKAMEDAIAKAKEAAKKAIDIAKANGGDATDIAVRNAKIAADKA
jgi:hypothetical protein